MDRYFEELLTDTRGTRHGFPLNILMELSTLNDYYKTKMRTGKRDIGMRRLKVPGGREAR